MQTPKPYREERPWGEELWVSNDRPSMVKILSIKPHEELSLQYHRNRDEFWHVISGDGTAIVDNDHVSLKAGVDQFVPKGINHRLMGGVMELIILELSFGEFDEKDIIRLEDKYGRIT
ncbi:MAG: hypothetical protein A3C79_00515 [Candidatus Taylorbacteria bacterium RIFCSPHIGHO2_02_FULL_45_28]|uniref:Mannose-6-phosphate isomerase type II C-terminal domain-containing protein n=1 Tax=Candidatus Taylorbacteria bacterium RIFCSPHIGHO2_12_FULL_45_16 TaxID=1802315 RepID=A0A1G2N1T7_9BACT|nr:MAG: hypothetical protein A2830_01770 [Candidatus Taylorbacteria bacterium RIFCSPHIGHO2_01_FULL_44_110]OHA25504.1 MAG: hypothetical protein A3C79_00515 [Candidatus Taylorbacteria bacterium RIFCSPHIGHO2_02_FULL_45_28]OHA29171.1 MAG: hypothetical protein A3F51_00980 [Candidatus Taylorbacteria bacterium RIFCSPHIGHO2_12_FULL_45_16]OHA33393.1 MAG: hypothetical protein A3A23_01860 [Candidatus Taylorbacteria bacterium RIFCSPLOWO2_01_FULL_45_59]OHA39479.1 MAG: hypothetical protein A3I98_03830 [Candi